MKELAVILVLAGCAGAPANVLDIDPDAVLERLRTNGHAVGATLGGGAVRYLGFEAQPEGALPGDTITVVHWWAAVRPLDRPYRVFVHCLVDGARGWIPHGDHDPIPATDAWPPGKVIRDEHRIVLPTRVPGRAIELQVGLYIGDTRLSVDRASHHDGANVIRAGRIGVGGTPVRLPSYRAPRLVSAPVIDGVIDDREWAGAPWIEGFVVSDGGAQSSVSTRARLAWDATHLYWGFIAEDPDLLATFTARDQPLYREEALEIFIAAAGDARSYVEIQLSPRNVVFDAAFDGGPRRNMRTDWHARLTSAVRTDGTVDAMASARPPDADGGWSGEMAIAIASLPGAAPPTPDTRWRINMFRISKDRVPGSMRTDESAWSAPLQGDFHNLERFGELVLSQ